MKTGVHEIIIGFSKIPGYIWAIIALIALPPITILLVLKMKNKRK